MKGVDMRKEERPRNYAEAMLYDIMVASGWKLTKRGWPDFLCKKDGRVVVIEVKSKRGHRLKEEQKEMLLWFSQAGIEAYRWTPAGFEPVKPTIDDIEDCKEWPTKKVLDRQRKRKAKGIKGQQRFIEKSLDIVS